MKKYVEKANNAITKLSKWAEQLFDPSFLKLKKTDNRLKRTAKIIGKVGLAAVWIGAAVTNFHVTAIAFVGAATVSALPDIAKAQARRAMATEIVKDIKPSQTSQRPPMDPELKRILQGLGDKPKAPVSQTQVDRSLISGGYRRE